LLRIFKSRRDGGPDRYIHGIAIPLITAGLVILAAPALRDVLLHLLDKVLQTNLDFAQTPKTGFFLLIAGLFVYVGERLFGFGASPLLALRHQSFLPLPRSLSSRDLPAKIALNRVQPIDCDLYAVMNSTPKNLEAALSIQSEWANKVVGTITSLPNAPVAYYGIVHIPFQFLAGFRFSTFKHVHFFELERANATWRELRAEKSASDLTLIIEKSKIPEAAQDVAIRISISYMVHQNEVVQVLPISYGDVHIHLPIPRIDAIESYADLRNVCSRFRQTLDLDEVRSKRVHVFYSGPVSLGFALGQQISPSIHGEVHVYNYDASSAPAYSWSVQLAQLPQAQHVRLH
jgi:hypothetical protein